MRRRKLTREELDLWTRAMSTAERLHPVKDQPADGLPKPKPIKYPITPQAGTNASNSDGPYAGKVRSSTLTAIPPARAAVHMDQKIFGRMKRGKLAPEARVDLHGMQLDRAHSVLTRFILSAQTSGKRLVLVITGKGKQAADDGPIPTPRGVLRRQVPIWLAQPPLHNCVLQVSQAHVSHGGEGAYYVYLRRLR